MFKRLIGLDKNELIQIDSIKDIKDRILKLNESDAIKYQKMMNG